jgi:hypothetical protein
MARTIDGEPPTNDGIIFRRGFNSFEPLCEKTRQSIRVWICRVNLSSPTLPREYSMYREIQSRVLQEDLGVTHSIKKTILY